jgi:hypothetical protein
MKPIFKIGDTVKLSDKCLRKVDNGDYILEFEEWAQKHRTNRFVIKSSKINSIGNVTFFLDSDHKRDFPMIPHEMIMVAPKACLPEELFTL